MIKVLLVDDHTIMRDGLKQIFADTNDIIVVGEAEDGREALKQLESLEVDVMVLDMTMPGRSGLDLLKQIKIEKPKLSVIILSMHSENQYASRAYRAGASGYVSKASASSQLVSAIYKVASGGVYISPLIAERMAIESRNSKVDDAVLHNLLSDREFQIFKMIAEGKGLTEIANELSLSVKTISTHKTHIMGKMHFLTTAELIRYAMNHGFID